MNEAGYTPGPWTHEGRFVVAYGENGANICAISEPRASSTVGYTELTRNSKDGQEAYANARLIAAAPDLLAAARDAIVALEDGEGLGFQGGDEAYAALKQAIAKAENSP